MAIKYIKDFFFRKYKSDIFMNLYLDYLFSKFSMHMVSDQIPAASCFFSFFSFFIFFLSGWPYENHKLYFTKPDYLAE